MDIDFDYPLPDPAWDYWAEYQAAIALHKQVTELIATMSDWETRSPENDQTIRDHLKRVSEQVSNVMGLLD